MKRHKTDYRLWYVTSIVLFGCILGRLLTAKDGAFLRNPLFDYAIVILALCCIGVGWLVHAFMVVLRSRSEQKETSNPKDDSADNQERSSGP